MFSRDAAMPLIICTLSTQVQTDAHGQELRCAVYHAIAPAFSYSCIIHHLHDRQIQLLLANSKAASQQSSVDIALNAQGSAQKCSPNAAYICANSQILVQVHCSTALCATHSFNCSAFPNSYLFIQVSHNLNLLDNECNAVGRRQPHTSNPAGN